MKRSGGYPSTSMICGLTNGIIAFSSSPSIGSSMYVTAGSASTIRRYLRSAASRSASACLRAVTSNRNPWKYLVSVPSSLGTRVEVSCTQTQCPSAWHMRYSSSNGAPVAPAWRAASSTRAWSSGWTRSNQESGSSRKREDS
jgi:hypothetical protein